MTTEPEARIAKLEAALEHCIAVMREELHQMEKFERRGISSKRYMRMRHICNGAESILRGEK
jgi:hypothetical protein